MLPSSGPGKISTVGLLLFFVFFAAVVNSWGAEIQVLPLGTILEKSDPQKLTLIAGKSIILKSARPITRISEPDPNIALTLLLSPNEIYVTPKGVGATNLILWLENNTVIYDLEVAFDVSRLKQRLHEVLPLETELRVIPTNDNITLAGRVSCTASLDQALSVVQSYVPADCSNKIRNLVEVAGVHQVMLEVRVAEISKSDTKRLGFNFQYFIGSDFGITMLGALSNATYDPRDGLSTVFSSNVNALFRFGNNPTWTALIDALKEDGVVKVLAEPTLITMSGQNASFLAGGEFPIPVPGGSNVSTTIEFKPYGVGLNFLPTVLSPDRINIRVTPDVSELDYSNSVKFGGYVVPGISVRRASTTVELGDGQSFAIAGLLRENTSDNISKFPLLGDLPILGMLFRSSAFQKKQTELVIVVTPRLVKPSNQKKQLLPTDNFIEPSFMDMAFPEFNSTANTGGVASNRGTLDGEFGSVMPNT